MLFHAFFRFGVKRVIREITFKVLVVFKPFPQLSCFAFTDHIIFHNVCQQIVKLLQAFCFVRIFYFSEKDIAFGSGYIYKVVMGFIINKKFLVNAVRSFCIGQCTVSFGVLDIVILTKGVKPEIWKNAV